MKMSNKTFDTLRLITEIVGYIVTFLLAVSEIVGFKYGAEAAAISAALMTCLGSIVEAARRNYQAEKEADDVD